MNVPATLAKTPAWLPTPQRAVSTSSARLRAAGSTLTEVLVTVAILAFGMLLMTKLLTESLRAFGENRQQQRALRLAADLGELLGNLDTGLVRGTTTPAAHGCAHTVCTPPQFLADSLQRWQIRATQQLPDGAGRIDFIPNGDETFAAISVQWSRHDGARVQYLSQVALHDRP